MDMLEIQEASWATGWTGLEDSWQVLPRSFYEPSAAKVAPALLGRLLLRRTERGWCGGVIVETEAYLVNDPACHAFRGETARNRAMFGPPGHAYVYFIYGNHHCFNAVCGPPGQAEAVLVRAIEPLVGVEGMMERRRVSRRIQLTNGPGKLCAALDVERDLDGIDLCLRKGAQILIADPPWRRQCRAHLGPVETTPRIGISRAADLMLRFCLKGSAYVSRR